MPRLFGGGRILHFDLAAAGRASEAGRGDAIGRRGWIIHIIDIALAIHGPIGQAVGEGIFVAKVVSEADGFKIADEGLRLLEQGLEGGVFDSIFAQHLFDDQFAVAANKEFASAELGGLAKTDDQGHVFGDVIGGSADVFTEGDQGRIVLGGENNADAGRAGISPAAAVEVERDGFVHLRILEGHRNQMQPPTRASRPTRLKR